MGSTNTSNSHLKIVPPSPNLLLPIFPSDIGTSAWCSAKTAPRLHHTPLSPRGTSQNQKPHYSPLISGPAAPSLLMAGAFLPAGARQGWQGAGLSSHPPPLLSGTPGGRPAQRVQSTTSPSGEASATAPQSTGATSLESVSKDGPAHLLTVCQEPPLVTNKWWKTIIGHREWAATAGSPGDS